MYTLAQRLGLIPKILKSRILNEANPPSIIPSLGYLEYPRGSIAPSHSDDLEYP